MAATDDWAPVSDWTPVAEAPTVGAHEAMPPVPTEGGVASAPKPAAGPAGKVPRHNSPQEKALDASRTGRVLDAVGQGLKNGWGAEPIGLSPESEKFLKDAGIFNSTQGGVMAPLRAFNEILIRPAAAALDTAWRGLNAVPYGIAALVGANVGEATGKKGMDWDAARDTLALAQTFGIVGGFREGRFDPETARPVAAVETPPITGPRNALTIADEHATAVMTEDTQAMRIAPSPAGDFGPQRASLEDAQAAADATPRRPAAPVALDLVVARKMPDGNIQYGRPGEIHADLLSESEVIHHANDSIDEQMGFAIGQGEPFMSRKDALAWVEENQPGRASPAHEQGELDAGVYRPEQPRPTVMAAERTDPQTPHQLFGPVETTTVIDKAGNIRLDNADWSEGAKSVFRQVAEENGGPDAFLDARRGVQTLALREQAADAMGTDASWLLNAKKGQAFNDAEIEYATRIAVQSANDTFEAMRKAALPDAAEADILRYAELKARHQSIQERFSAATAEGGRTLNALKKAKAATEEAQSFNDYIKGATGKSVDDLKMEAELGSRLNSPQQLSKFLMESRKATTGDMLIEAWINGLLSGPATHVTNIVSNVATALWNIPETAVAAAIGKLHGGPERVMFGEAGQELFGIVQGSREGLFVAAKAFKEETTTTPGKVDLARHRAIPGALGRGVRVPGRLLSSEDEFFKAIGRRQAINRIAYRKASQEGLKGADHSARVAELVENPTDAMKTYAEEQAAYQTFTNPLGALGQGLQDIQAANKAIRLVLTFVRTPLNIAKYTLKDRTPLGLLSKELREDMAGANGPIARDTAIARMAVGTAVGVTAISMAARGLITGGGPSDPQEKALLYATGWQPYSFKVGDMYYSYARIEPLGTILGIPANLYEASQDDKNEGFTDAAGMFVASLAKNMASKTSLTGLMDLVQAVEDPDRYGKQYVEKLGGTIIPSGVAQYARTQDPYLRETADFVETLKSRVPGLRETLLPKRDIWGEPIKLGGGLGPDLVSPIYESRIKNDPVTRELITLGITPSQPDKMIKGADLSPALYDEYQMVAGRLAKTTLDGIVGQTGWTDQPAFVRREVITNTMERTRRMAAGYMQMKHPELIQAAVENRIKAVTGVEK